MNPDPDRYLSEAISRAERDELSGSHLAGVFSRCATNIEKEVRLFVKGLLLTCKLDYDSDVYSPPLPREFRRTTLGNLIAIVKTVRRLRPKESSSIIRMPVDLTDELRKINDAWVMVKHGDDVSASKLLANMKFMIVVKKAIRSSAQERKR